ncbi:Cof-type HAD-IIB family hydrolase [Fusibacter ferrireducens]|uniref:Cof-type HAD-IIB family hydrolase n=1 Tax=Fusibacter ferrireducens TaxID=2785058 RepID=A0ABR9ZT21_9FIRM|nr:Cof-type HAD-IIB family hydrolase [Fusibacter ferrireducens]MBF4693030.1 Cof-type HAD-IIB family hydrolase [Fusibacter ferrireducens]
MENNKKIKAVISDLDGTLLNQYHTLSELSKETIKALKTHDVQFLIATGRHHCDAKNIRERLDVDAFIIAANGATVLNPAGEIIHQAVMNPEVVAQLLSMEIEAGVFKNIYQEDRWMVETIDRVFEDYHQEGDFVYTLCKFEEQLSKPINKVFFTSRDHSLLIPIEKQVLERYGEHVDVAFSVPECLEVMPKGTNKGQALIETLKHLGITLDESVAFGDGMNDFEMLSVVGTGYLMANANEQLKKRLPNNPQVGHHSEDAVAKKIIELFSIESVKKDPLSAS